MKITQLLTPIADVHWLVSTDTVRDAFDHLETYGVTAAPIVDWAGRYVGTITEADLRRTPDRAAKLASVQRRSHVAPIAIDGDADALADMVHPFVPVVDGTGRMVGIVERRRIPDVRLPDAA